MTAKKTKHTFVNADVISAEQHALDNPRHVLTVTFVRYSKRGLLTLACQSCRWWDQQIFPEGGGK